MSWSSKTIEENLRSQEISEKKFLSLVYFNFYFIICHLRLIAIFFYCPYLNLFSILKYGYRTLVRHSITFVRYRLKRVLLLLHRL